MATDWQWHWHLLGFWSWVVVPSNPSWVWQCHTCTTDNCNYHPASWHYHYMHEDIFSSLRRSCSSWHHLPSPSPSASQSCQWHPTITIVTIECMRWTMESQQCHHHLHPHLLRYWLPLFFSLTFHLHSCRLTRIMHTPPTPTAFLFLLCLFQLAGIQTIQTQLRRVSVYFIQTCAHQCCELWHILSRTAVSVTHRDMPHSDAINWITYAMWHIRLQRTDESKELWIITVLWVIDPSSRGRIRQEQKQQQQ